MTNDPQQRPQPGFQYSRAQFEALADVASRQAREGFVGGDFHGVGFCCGRGVLGAAAGGKGQGQAQRGKRGKTDLHGRYPFMVVPTPPLSARGKARSVIRIKPPPYNPWVMNTR